MCPRAICLTCGRPSSACYCRHVHRLDTRCQVLILQHPREAKMPVNTGRMAHLSLVNSRLVIGTDWPDIDSLPEQLRQPNPGIALLYPGPNAQPISTIPSSPPPTLVVLDGTWSQAKTMFRDSPPLQALPRYSFVPDKPSEYRIRREPARDYVSTIEALAYVLQTLERDPGLPQALLEPFHAMVDWQVSCVTGKHQPRARTRPKPPRRVPLVPPALLDEPQRLVFVAAEANAWPRSMAASYPRELVHLVAFRPHTGDRFEAVVAPKHPICPATPLHAQLDEQALRAGVSRASLLKAWHQFIRDDDVLCSWGYYPVNLLKESRAFSSQQHVDLRGVVKNWTKHRWPSLRDACQAISRQPCEPTGRGRAPDHLAWVERLWPLIMDEARNR